MAQDRCDSRDVVVELAPQIYTGALLSVEDDNQEYIQQVYDVIRALLEFEGKPTEELDRPVTYLIMFLWGEKLIFVSFDENSCADLRIIVPADEFYYEVERYLNLRTDGRPYLPPPSDSQPVTAP